MASERNDSEELEQLRKILLGPFEEHLKLRDEKILEVVGKIQSSTFERVTKLEETVLKLSQALDDDRNRTVTEIGDAMAQLGQQLRGFGVEQALAPKPVKEVQSSDEAVANEQPEEEESAPQEQAEEQAEQPPEERVESAGETEPVEAETEVEEADVFEEEIKAEAAN